MHYQYLILLMFFSFENWIKPIESSSRIIVVNSNNRAAASNHRRHHDLIAKIISETNGNANSEHQSSGEDMYKFLGKLTDLGVRTRCEASLLRSDVQNRVKQLKSIVSACPLYCRVGVHPHTGLVYGAREFNLETLWERVDIDDESLLKNNALLGAYFIKFVFSKRYLCINKYGKLFAFVNKTNECLWFNDEPRLKSAVHPNIELVIDKNCHLDSPINEPLARDRRRQTNDKDSCESSVIITSGPSPNLRKFFHSCQSDILGNSHVQSTPPPAHVRHTHHPKSSTKPSQVVREKIELYCANFLLEEIEFADEITRFKPNSQARIPEICIEYLVRYQNKSIDMVNQTKTESVLANAANKAAHKAKSDAHKHVEEPSTLEHELDSGENYHNAVADGSKVNTNLRKCYLLRSTTLYKKCMEKHYKCYKFNNDPENLRKCRKKYGVTPAPRKKN